MKQKLIEGSSKIFYPVDEQQILMTFKDDIHGAQREKSIIGTGGLRKEFSYYFYRLLDQHGIPTHLVDLTDEGIVVKRCQPVKIEVLVRNVARGHWVDNHKIPLFEGGQRFDSPVVEFCLKMKKELNNGNLVDDPRINPALSVALHRYALDPEIRGNMIKNLSEAEEIENLALNINTIYQGFLHDLGWILEDFKFEVGVLPGTRQFILIDEISPDCSRIRDAEGNSLTKDLFRQRRSDEEIFAGYLKLREAIHDAHIRSSV